MSSFQLSSLPIFCHSLPIFCHPSCLCRISLSSCPVVVILITIILVSPVQNSANNLSNVLSNILKSSNGINCLPLVDLFYPCYIPPPPPPPCPMFWRPPLQYFKNSSVQYFSILLSNSQHWFFPVCFCPLVLTSVILLLSIQPHSNLVLSKYFVMFVILRDYDPCSLQLKNVRWSILYDPSWSKTNGIYSTKNDTKNEK